MRCELCGGSYGDGDESPGVCDGCPDAVIGLVKSSEWTDPILRDFISAVVNTPETRRAAAKFLNDFNERDGGTDGPA